MAADPGKKPSLWSRFINEREFNQPQAPSSPHKHEFLVERLIREAEEQGKFDNLANEGRPIKIEEDNPYIEEDLRLAYKVLGNAGFSPPWIEMEKEVEAELAQVQRERDSHRRWLKHRLDTIKHGPTNSFMRDLRLLADSHDAWLQSHARKLSQLNEKVHSFNHVCPVRELQKIPIQVERVIEEFDHSCPAIPRL